MLVANSTFRNKAVNCHGFTLVELVLVMLITGIMAGVTYSVISLPTESYEQITRRAALVDQAEMALRRMQRDVRRALPNSIRLSGATTLEMVNVVEGIRYRSGPAGNPAAELDFTTQDASFNTLGVFNTIAPNVNVPFRLVIYNQDPTSTGANIYDASGAAAGTPQVVTPAAGTTINIAAPVGNETNIQLNPGHQFLLSSPQQRLYLIDTPITYQCEGGRLIRYSGYAIVQDQPANPLDPPLANAFSIADVTRNVTACNFAFAPGATQRSGVLLLSLTLSIGIEKITLLHQVHVDNVP